MMKQKLEIVTNTYVDLFEGTKGKPMIGSNTYQEDTDACDPILTLNVSFEQLLSEWIEVNSVPNGTMTVEHRVTAARPLLKMIKILEKYVGKIDNIPGWEKPK